MPDDALFRCGGAKVSFSKSAATLTLVESEQRVTVTDIPCVSTEPFQFVKERGAELDGQFWVDEVNCLQSVCSEIPNFGLVFQNTTKYRQSRFVCFSTALLHKSREGFIL